MRWMSIGTCSKEVDDVGAADRTSASAIAASNAAPGVVPGASGDAPAHAATPTVGSGSSGAAEGADFGYASFAAAKAMAAAAAAALATAAVNSFDPALETSESTASTSVGGDGLGGDARGIKRPFEATSNGVDDLLATVFA